MKIGVKQRDFADCGAACLASVARFYNLKMPVSRIRQQAGTDRKGTSMAGMVEAASKLGFQSSGVRAKIEALNQITLPAIAHLIKLNNANHYVVILKFTGNSVKIMDPADGKQHTLPISKFRKEWTGVLLLLLPSPDFRKGNYGTKVFSYFLDLMKPHRAVLAQIVFGALIYTVLALSTAVFVQKIVDYVLVDNNWSLLNLMGIAMIVIFILQVVIGTIKTIFTLKTGQLIDARLILGYYTHVLKLPQQFFDTMRIGEISSRLNDAVKIRIFINDASINLIVNFFMMLFSLILMFTYYWKLALFMALIIPIYVLVYTITNYLNRKAQRKIMEEGAELEAQLVESLSALGTIKRFGLEDHTNTHTEKKFLKLLNTVYKSGLNSVFSSTSTDSISNLLIISSLWIGAGMVLQQEISPGELLSFYTLIGYFTRPVSSTIEMNKIVQDAMIASDRLFEIMDLEQEADQESNVASFELRGSIRFENVCFRYGTRKPIFDSLNLEISLGELTGIIGNSGSGKSSLVSIIQRIYPVQSGRISIANTPLKYIPNHALRRFIAVVPQRIDLFSANIIENIAIGDPKPDFSRVMSICYQLGITDFIESLPNGFYSQLGENGATLSGGQKQRIAIARAVYREPEILILDETSSALDPASEDLVKKYIDQLVIAGKTVIVISHRLSMIKDASKIVVMNDGGVSEQGTHEELIILQGSYWELWKQNRSEVGVGKNGELKKHEINRTN